MTIVLTLPLIVATAGALVFGLASGKLSQAGLGAFVAGLAAFLIRVH